MSLSQKIENTPKFPGILSIPLKFVPSTIHSRILVGFLNLLLKEQINEGELDFLENRRLCIKVSDVNIMYFISLNNNRLITVKSNSNCDIELQANVYDYLQLAARKQDPDTLVFQRKLVMQGNTELGLELKNFLDSLDFESNRHFEKIERLLKNSLPIYKRLFS
ncbi:MAG: SCP2 sterol-binding domain-containing protein [Gammaproteobacteria bacterium]|nr:SCP2 sterol-binding domain-containing protein [Gammaproteobacteria bacterium]